MKIKRNIRPSPMLGSDSTNSTWTGCLFLKTPGEGDGWRKTGLQIARKPWWQKWAQWICEYTKTTFNFSTGKPGNRGENQVTFPIQDQSLQWCSSCQEADSLVKCTRFPNGKKRRGLTYIQLRKPVTKNHTAQEIGWLSPLGIRKEAFPLEFHTAELHKRPLTGFYFHCLCNITSNPTNRYFLITWFKFSSVNLKSKWKSKSISFWGCLRLYLANTLILLLRILFWFVLSFKVKEKGGSFKYNGLLLKPLKITNLNTWSLMSEKAIFHPISEINSKKKKKGRSSHPDVFRAP